MKLTHVTKFLCLALLARKIKKHNKKKGRRILPSLSFTANDRDYPSPYILPGEALIVTTSHF